GREAHQVAVLAEDENPVAVDGGGGARAGGPVHIPVFPSAPDLRLPDLLAVRLVECVEPRRAVAVAGGIDPAPANGDAAHPLADPVCLPGQRRPVLGPLPEQALLLRDRSPVWPLP